MSTSTDPTESVAVPDKQEEIAKQSNNSNNPSSSNNSNPNGKKRVRRHRVRKRKKQEKGDETDSVSESKSPVKVAKNKNSKNAENDSKTNKSNIANISKSTKNESNNLINGKNKNNVIEPKNGKSSIGTSFNLKVSKKPRNNSNSNAILAALNKNNNNNNNNNNNKNNKTRTALDAIMRQEKKIWKKTGKIENNTQRQTYALDTECDMNGIEKLVTEEELLQAILLESMHSQKSPNKESNINTMTNTKTNNSNEANKVPNDTNMLKNDKNDKNEEKETNQIESQSMTSKVPDTTNVPNITNTNIQTESQTKMNKNSEVIDSDYLIAMSLQESEESQYFQQKAWHEQNSGSKYAKVQSCDGISDKALNFYFNNEKSELEDNNKEEQLKLESEPKTKIKTNTNTNRVNEVEESLYDWTGSHVDTAGTKKRHDKKTWSKKHISRMNDYDGIGSQLDENVAISNQAYNSFCRSVERKGFKREYM